MKMMKRMRIRTTGSTESLKGELFSLEKVSTTS